MPLLWLFIALQVGHTQNMPPASVQNKMGYFVLTGTTYFGNQVNDASCLTELAGSWKGKAEAGVLTAARVKAFVCNATACANLKPSTYYAFAAVGNIGVGGAVFGSDPLGRGPGDSSSWSGINYFGSAQTYWIGPRASYSGTMWDTFSTGAAYHCSNWSTSVSVSATTAASSSTNSNRWSGGVDLCTSPHPIICIVDPE